MADPFLQDAVRRQSDRVFDPLAFEIFVDSGIGEARVSTEMEARDLAFVSRDDWLQHAIPTVGAVNIAGSQGGSFQIAKLIEQEQWMMAGAGVMLVQDAVFLFAMGGADA